MKFVRTAFLHTLILSTLPIFAAAPSGYYDSCKGKKGQALLKQLETVISGHTTVSYNGLWELYKTSDIDENGKIWDMYSTKRWRPGSEQCGNYSGVGSCYNREHSFPKSWFDDQSPMYSDAFHLYPTDGAVNGQRGNNPFGECANGTTLPAPSGIKALGKLGNSTFPGYSGKVFEPDDQYKGDFARSYFYMAACYNSRFSSFSSPMLAGNSFPCFKQWAIDLLLKWHRQDPVSKKETDRNEAVYKKQRNRNPFIDHPELAEHIWGNQSSTGWQDGGSTPATPVFSQPTASSTFDLGRGAVNTDIKKNLTVKGANFTSAATVSVSGSGFSVNPTSISAAAINAGTSVTVALRRSTAGKSTGTLTITSGSTTVSINLTGEAVSGIPANSATDITESSFKANWVNIGDAQTTYKLYVAHNSTQLAGYPKDVKASALSYTVDGLESGTTYEYWLTGLGVESNHVSVTTHNEMPELNVSIDEDLLFRSSPGEPSAPKTILLDAYMIDCSIDARVKAPFEISSNRTNWSTTLSLEPEEDHFYLRLNSAEAGVFYTTVEVSAAGLFNDDLQAQGTVADDSQPFFESFEAALTAGYTAEALEFDAALWDMTSAGVFDQDTRIIHSGKHGVRFNMDSNGYIEMKSPKRGGLGTVTFWTRLFDASPATMLAEWSDDGGATWHPLATVNPSSDWQQTSATVNTGGDNMLLRFTKTSGGRMALDDISATDYGMSGIETTEQTAQTWEAYGDGNRLFIENLGSETISAKVYDLNGSTRFATHIAAGAIVSTIPSPGVYIVVVDDESRRVVIR